MFYHFYKFHLKKHNQYPKTYPRYIKMVHYFYPARAAAPPTISESSFVIDSCLALL